jgi:hypothetical protein
MAPKVETVCFSETLMSTYKSTQPKNPEQKSQSCSSFPATSLSAANISHNFPPLQTIILYIFVQRQPSPPSLLVYPSFTWSDRCLYIQHPFARVLLIALMMEAVCTSKTSMYFETMALYPRGYLLLPVVL